MIVEADRLARLRAALVAWFAENARTLPWRGTRDPYAVWISEIMCQQTRVDTVVGYYARWMARFPTVEALAAASEDDVFALWQGLGYYTRARNLHRSARLVVGSYGGRLPETAEALLALPGVGRYTAGAIASIAFEEPAPVVDGNVARVLSRVLALRDDPKSTAALAVLWRTAEALARGPRPGDLNQAMMELGALVCTPRSPRCHLCPIVDDCDAARFGIADRLPVKSARTKVRDERRVALRVERPDGAVLMARNPAGTLLGGLWQFPMALADGRPVETLAVELVGEPVERLRALEEVEHVFSHIRMTVVPIVGSVRGGDGEQVVGYAEARWVSPDQLERLARSRLVAKLVERFGSADCRGVAGR